MLISGQFGWSKIICARSRSVHNSFVFACFVTRWNIGRALFGIVALAARALFTKFFTTFSIMLKLLFKMLSNKKPQWSSNVCNGCVCTNSNLASTYFHVEPLIMPVAFKIAGQLLNVNNWPATFRNVSSVEHWVPSTGGRQTFRNWLAAHHTESYLATDSRRQRMNSKVVS